MSYFEKTQILAGDTPSIDAFGRWRVSNPFTLFDSKNIYDTGSRYYTHLIADATASYMDGYASIMLGVTGSNALARRQSREYQIYQPGKSQLIITTCQFGNAMSGIIKRTGYFDSTNGLFFAQHSSSFGVGIRNNGTTIFTSQSAWNLDKFDGTGPSGKTLDLTKSQIFFIDFEWLGVGRIRYGIFQGGNAYYVHQITNINALGASSPVYMANSNLPVRFEIESSGSNSGSFTAICSAVASEGGAQDTGTTRAYDNHPGYSVGAGTYKALFALRGNPSYPAVKFLPTLMSILSPGNSNYQWTILLNPTVAVAWTWQNVTGSKVQFATGSDAQAITSDGLKLASGYVATSQAAGSVQFSRDQVIGNDGSNPDIIVLGARNLGNAAIYYGSLTWREIV